MNPVLIGAIADAAKGSEIGEIKVGTGNIDHGKGENAKITDAEGNINFGNVKKRFDNIPAAPVPLQTDDMQMDK